jgi:L-lactate dehydrogenase complex protein LldF
MKQHADLPFASTLCGSCSHVCPVKIDIHDQLYKWRQVIVQRGYVSPSKKIAMKIMSAILSNTTNFSIAGRWGRWILRNFSALLNNRLNPWVKQRNMPEAPAESFREWYQKNKTKHD